MTIFVEIGKLIGEVANGGFCFTTHHRVAKRNILKSLLVMIRSVWSDYLVSTAFITFISAFFPIMKIKHLVLWLTLTRTSVSTIGSTVILMPSWISEEKHVMYLLHSNSCSRSYWSKNITFHFLYRCIITLATSMLAVLASHKPLQVFLQLYMHEQVKT